MIRHFVLLNFQADVSADEKQVLFTALDRLRGHLRGILDFQSRSNISVEQDLIHGFEDMFWFDFIDENARAEYLADAEHQAVGTRIVARTKGGALGVVVSDFVV